jgi:lipopolysaccharide export system protein LptC
MRLAVPWPLPWPATAAANPYSRRVARLRLILPATGLAMLLVVAAWPRLAPIFERIRFAFPAIDLRDARELRMLNPRYAGIDRQNRPFLVTAAIGRQVPDRQELMELEGPQADLKTKGGAAIVITAVSGMYQSQAQMLDLFSNVTLVHENGTRIVTQSARVDVANNAASGREPVEGHGPSGDVKGQGFQVLDKGEDIIFTGQSELFANGAKDTAAAQPPTVPPAVAAIAARAEAEAKPASAATAKAKSNKSPAKTRQAASHGEKKHAAPKPAAKKSPEQKIAEQRAR